MTSIRDKWRAYEREQRGTSVAPAVIQLTGAYEQFPPQALLQFQELGSLATNDLDYVVHQQSSTALFDTTDGDLPVSATAGYYGTLPMPSADILTAFSATGPTLCARWGANIHKIGGGSTQARSAQVPPTGDGTFTGAFGDLWVPLTGVSVVDGVITLSGPAQWLVVLDIQVDLDYR